MKYLATHIEGFSEDGYRKPYEDDLVLVFNHYPDERDVRKRLGALGIEGPRDEFEFTTVVCRDVDEWQRLIRSEWSISSILDGIKREDLQEVEDDDGVMMKALYLGSLINPSGRYYLPFACGNVAGDCEVCTGSGRLRNALHDKEAFGKAVAESEALDAEMRATHGFPIDWPKKARDRRKELVALQERSQPDIECPHCGGSGSQSAEFDRLWRRAFELELDMRGLHLEQGLNGDGCDFFVVQYAVDEDQRPNSGAEKTVDENEDTGADNE